jgi:hypothetical protein
MECFVDQYFRKKKDKNARVPILKQYWPSKSTDNILHFQNQEHFIFYKACSTGCLALNPHRLSCERP